MARKKATRSDWRRYGIHKYAAMFPPMSKPEYEALKQDIREHGLKEPILLFKGKVLDGRNRFRACIDLDEAGELPSEPQFREFPGDDQAAYKEVASLNMMRRHLTKSQKAMVLVLAGLVTPPSSDGRRREYGTGKDAIMEVGKRYGVNHVTLYKASYIASRDEELAREVADGVYSVPMAERRLKEQQEGASVRGSKMAEDPDIAEMLEEFDSLETELRSFKKVLKRIQGKKWIDNAQSKEVQGLINQAWDILKQNKPGRVCPKCRGRGCTDCSKRGWQPERQ